MLWWVVALFVAAAAFYAYTISSSIRISPRNNCASCPKEFAKEKGF
jgi:hypothetical protein